MATIDPGSAEQRTGRCFGIAARTPRRVRDTMLPASMVIVLRNGKVNRIPQTNENRCEISILAISHLSAPATRLRQIHRDT
jgi:hypothetical protein